MRNLGATEVSHFKPHYQTEQTDSGNTRPSMATFVVAVWMEARQSARFLLRAARRPCSSFDSVRREKLNTFSLSLTKRTNICLGTCRVTRDNWQPGNIWSTMEPALFRRHRINIQPEPPARLFNLIDGICQPHTRRTSGKYSSNLVLSPGSGEMQALAAHERVKLSQDALSVRCWLSPSWVKFVHHGRMDVLWLQLALGLVSFTCNPKRRVCPAKLALFVFFLPSSIAFLHSRPLIQTGPARHSPGTVSHSPCQATWPNKKRRHQIMAPPEVVPCSAI